MNIGIDFRMSGTQYGGIGRYVSELVRSIAKIDKINSYFLFYCEDGQKNLIEREQNLHFIKVPFRHYSFSEQVFLSRILSKYNLDLVHFPNFNFPIRYKKNFIVTIHDLIHHRFGGVKKTNALHFLAYKQVIKRATHQSKKIITVSNASKADIVNEFKISPEKIKVIYEGISLHGNPTPKQVADFKAKFFLNKPYFVFVGIMQRNKNLSALAKGFQYFLQTYKLDFDLVMVGKADPHYPEIKHRVLDAVNPKNIVFTGSLNDSDLKAAYAGAYAYVSCSQFEGFGLPGIEAMSYGLPLAVSNIPVFNEIYEDGALYFDPDNPKAVAQCLNLLAQDRLYYMQIKNKALQRSKSFSWEKCAKETLQVYKAASL